MYGQLVLDAPESEDRDKMMGVMNVMCGNVEIDCAYAVLNIRRDERNIFGQIGQSSSRYHEKCFCPRMFSDLNYSLRRRSFG